MKISGHKTRRVFERYNVVCDTNMVDAASKIEAGAHNPQLTRSEAESHSNDERQKERKSIQSVS
jgi:hypothetical protein